MADNYLERRYAEYEKKKQEYLRKKKTMAKGKTGNARAPR